MQKQLQPYHYVWLEKHPERTEEWLRMCLKDGFHIHHVDGNHANNAPDNLILVEGHDHLHLHGMDLRGLAAQSRKIKKSRKAVAHKQKWDSLQKEIDGFRAREISERIANLRIIEEYRASNA